MFRKILYTTDFTSVSKKAFGYVKKLREAGTEEVIILHVVPEDVVETMTEGCLLRDESVKQCENEAIAKIKEKAMEKIKPMEEELKNEGMVVRTLVLIGKPAKTIAEIAEKEKVSLIVMGTHGHSLFREAFVGSVAETVVHYVNIPVLLVR